MHADTRSIATIHIKSQKVSAHSISNWKALVCDNFKKIAKLYIKKMTILAEPLRSGHIMTE